MDLIDRIKSGNWEFQKILDEVKKYIEKEKQMCPVNWPNGYQFWKEISKNSKLTLEEVLFLAKTVNEYARKSDEYRKVSSNESRYTYVAWKGWEKSDEGQYDYNGRYLPTQSDCALYVIARAAVARGATAEELRKIVSYAEMEDMISGVCNL